jgi:hypothetical protein
VVVSPFPHETALWVSDPDVDGRTVASELDVFLGMRGGWYSSRTMVAAAGRTEVVAASTALEVDSGNPLPNCPIRLLGF